MAKEKELNNKESEEEKEIQTILADDIDFTGNLKFTTSLKIKGKFSGEIDSTGHLFIGKDANVKANVKVRFITIYGKVKGNVEASEKIELFSGAELIGDIKTPDFIIQSGCVFNGNCVMVTKDKSMHHAPVEEEKTKKEIKEK